MMVEVSSRACVWFVAGKIKVMVYDILALFLDVQSIQELPTEFIKAVTH